MSLQQLLLLLMLAQSGYCLMIQRDSSKCSNGQAELFSKQQYFTSGDSGGGYQLIVKEILKHNIVTSKDSYFTDKDQMVEYQGVALNSIANFSKVRYGITIKSWDKNLKLCMHAIMQLNYLESSPSQLHLFKLMLGAVSNQWDGLTYWILSGMSHNVYWTR